MLHNAIPNPFVDRAEELSSALASFRLAADDLWALVNDCISALPEKFDIEKSCNPFGAIRELRTAVAPMRSFLKTLCDDHAILDARERSLQRSLDSFKDGIDSSAMKYGLDCLPNELLLRIFCRVATDMKSTVVLSHVCQRFRSIVNGTPAFWNRFWLSAGWKEDQVLAVAERCRFCDLRAVIQNKYNIRQDPGAAVAILSLSERLVELSIDGLYKQFFDKIRARLRSEPIHFPRLRVLTSWRSLNIVLLHPEEISEMPSLQVLETDFIPHTPQASSLTKLALDLHRGFRVSGLVAFLSSATALEELSLDMRLTNDEQETVEQASTCLPKLVDLRFITDRISNRTASIVASKIYAPSLRVLRLQTDGDVLANAGIQSIVASNLSFTELHLSHFCRIDLCHVPTQVKTLVAFVGAHVQFECSGGVTSHQLRLIRLCPLHAKLHSYAVDVRDSLRAAGLNIVQIEFPENVMGVKYSGYKPGIYSLEDMDLAFNNGD